LGRADRVKGIDTLIKAVRAAPDLDVELHLYGVTGSADDEYWSTLKKLAAHDARISFLSPVPHSEITKLLSGFHLTAVPSRWLETGPLVVLESFAAGVPVVGSDLGGIAEWVKHGQNGLLVKHDSVGDWTAALRRCAEDRNLLLKLRKGIEAPRSMTRVAEEMAQMYSRSIQSAAVGTAGAVLMRESLFATYPGSTID
jgi:glycosyltransferase involved in cell wall biosynthesis